MTDFQSIPACSRRWQVEGMVAGRGQFPAGSMLDSNFSTFRQASGGGPAEGKAGSSRLLTQRCVLASTSDTGGVPLAD